tara:strand:+ start:193 stop:942 length:750 start_codon:yes stop_codon:yes gene_type:complete
MEEKPPSIWKLSVFRRSIFDFDIILNSQDHGPFFRSIDTINDLLQEQKSIGYKLNILYFITFVGALLVLSGPLPPDTKIAAFGVEAPIGFFPQQVIAVMMAVAFSFYGTQFVSLSALTQMNAMILSKEGREIWQFFAARFDASLLWSAMMTPRAIGYKSPRRHYVISISIICMSFLTVFAHAVVIITASFVALRTAVAEANWVLIMFGGLSLMICVATVFLFILMFTWKIPFRLDPSEAEQSSVDEAVE